MGVLDDVQTFVREAKRATTLDELRTLLGDASAELGFSYFALSHHVCVVTDDLVQFGNYPESWIERLLNQGYLLIDPAVKACQNTVAGFCWSEIPELITLSPDQKRILEECQVAGFGEGFTVPLHLPGEFAASCSFVTRRGQKVNQAITPAAHFIGCFAFEAVRRLRRKSDPGPSPDCNSVPLLSGRQLDCIVLAARGKSATDSGVLLGISKDTVHQHLETAKRRYGVATRSQLIVRVLFDCRLTFSDVLSR
jgi:LuxR family quorum-sensing system transcriptional regulator CciR